MAENEVKACEKTGLVLPFVLFVFVFVFVLPILFCTSKDFTLPAEPFFCLLDFGVLERTLSLQKKDKGSVRHKGTSALERKREVRCNIIVCYHRLDGNSVFSCFVLFLSYVFWRSSPMSQHTSHLTR